MVRAAEVDQNTLQYRMLNRTGWLFALIALMTGCLSLRAMAEEKIDAIDPAAFTAFMDEQMKPAIGRDWIGASVVLVENGRIAASRGYGFADLATHRPIDPLNTGFRLGSISKIFTTMGVLRLVDQGKLKLDDPIAPRIADIPLGQAGKGVTIHNILTHTDGFEVGWSIGGCVRDERKAISLKQFLLTHLPPRIQPPGRMYAYSDVGMSLAGHAIENIDGRSFEQFEQDEIFAPLGMNHTTFLQPPPKQITDNLATAYRKFGGEFQVMPLEHILPVPSAGVTTTPGDMARFMLAYLNHGEIDGQHILQPATADLMQTRQFTNHPALPGTAYGLYEHVENGERAFQHGGVMLGYHGLLLLFPQHNAGIFFVANSYGDESFDPFIKAFFDRFFPKTDNQPEAPTTAPAAPPPTDLSGRYRYVQYPHFSMGKLVILTGMVEERRVREQPDGSIIVDQGLKGPWKYVAPLLYSRGEEKLAFQQDDSGHTIGMAYGAWAFERIQWYQGRRAQTALIILLTTTFILSILGRSITRLRFRVCPSPKACRDFAAIACAINLLFLIGLSYSIWGQDILQWYCGLPTLVMVLRWVPWIGLLATLAAAGFTMNAIRSASWKTTGKIAHLLTLTALAVFPVFCWYWNLLALSN
jgi:CubicO group peptidase (beta-lactamase class C family)